MVRVPLPETRRKWIRRGLKTVGAGFAGITGLVGVAYLKEPALFRRLIAERSRVIHPPSSVPDPNKWSDKGIHAAWLGHSTVLLKVDGYTILTDPVFSDYAGIHLGPVSLGVKRMVAPPIPPSKLPPIDLVLSSHAHMDHLDVPSMRKLEGKKTSVIMAHETDDLVRADRYQKVATMRWGDQVQLGPAAIRAFQVNHWGARMRNDTYRGYNGYLIDIGRYRVLFGGDTAYTDKFAEIRASKPVDLAIMPIGAYDPWRRVHCTPEEALKMGNLTRAEHFLPVHHKTFQLSNEPIEDPIRRFVAAVVRDSHRVLAHDVGDEAHLT